MCQKTFIYLYLVLMCLPANPDTFQKEANFQNIFKNFLQAPLFNHNINGNYSFSWDGSRDFLCFFAPSAIENITISRKHTRLKLGESFQEKLIPISSLQVFSKYPWRTSVSMDGVGRQNVSQLHSLILWVMITVIGSRCIYYQSQRFKHRFRVLVCKRQKMSLRVLLIKQKLTKLCTVKATYLNTKASQIASKPLGNNNLANRHAIARKGKYRTKFWLCVQSRNIYSCTLGYLFLLLVLCGDVHPNPGPVLPPHRRHPTVT